MIGLDTNILVRYIVRDDRRQTVAATRLLESSCTPESPGFVSLIVMCELVWVLSQGYGFGRAQVAGVLEKILAAEDLQVERSELAWRALHLYSKGKADYADYLIGLCGREGKAEATYTFDRKTANCPLFQILPVGDR